FKIYADNEPLKINSVQQIQEYVGGAIQYGYFLQFERPKQKPENYCIFRLEATHNAMGIEKGESVYFYEINDYK
ncbi:MAG: carboxypeptidase regulatory-like domain-containing protein, partial [Bacteroidales bacterium]|nr:carboxypeptidase regulatory-like domain-containing protein [Bacteroidales bacterium]